MPSDAATELTCIFSDFPDCSAMKTITFNVNSCLETGGYVARWDDPSGGGITTQGDSITELEAMVRDAVTGYFMEQTPLPRVRLHFVDDPEFAVA